MKKILMIVLAAASMSSCGLYSKYERPQDVQTDNIFGGIENGDSLGLGDLSWREVFTDPQLQSLIENTLANNVNMKQADNNIKKVEEGLRCSKLAYVPALAFSPSGTLSGGRIWDDVMGGKMNMSKSYTLPVSASWQLGNMGSLLNQKRKAHVTLEQMKIAKQATQTALVATVANLYYTLIMLDEQLAVSEQTLVNWNKNLEITRNLMDAGQANAAAVSSTEANIYSMQANVVDIKHNIHELQNLLCTLCGETPHHINRGSLSSWQAPSMITTGVPVAMLSRRPDVMLAEKALASSFYDKNLALSNMFPALTLTGNGNWTNMLTGMGVLNPGALIGSGIASIMQPLFANGRLRAQYRISKLQMENLAMDYQQSIIEAGTEVNNAMAKVQTAEEKRPLYDKQVAAMTKAVDATQDLMTYSNQYNYLNVLTAQTNLLNCQLGAIANQIESVQATIELYQALGGGAK